MSSTNQEIVYEVIENNADGFTMVEFNTEEEAQNYFNSIDKSIYGIELIKIYLDNSKDDEVIDFYNADDDEIY
jgi:hypothetical protein